MKKSVFILMVFFICIQSVLSTVKYKIIDSAETELIPLISNDIILSKIKAGAKVVFVDAREPEEFAEDHLPGALNMTLRQVNREVASKLRSADLIVTYCLKDFRGFELGRALKNQGLTNVRLMKAHGIYGWKKQELPITSRDGMTDVESVALLRRCANDMNDCGTSI